MRTAQQFYQVCALKCHGAVPCMCMDHSNSQDITELVTSQGLWPWSRSDVPRSSAAESVACWRQASKPYPCCMLTRCCAGGASTQFSMLPLNFAGPEDTTDYVVTGSWSKKTFDEGKKFTKANLVCKGDNKSIPSAWNLRLVP